MNRARGRLEALVNAISAGFRAKGELRLRHYGQPRPCKHDLEFLTLGRLGRGLAPAPGILRASWAASAEFAHVT
jgi:hypothetical protein